MLTRNGSCVTRIRKIRAGSSGSRRRQGEENGSPTFPLGVASAAVMTDLLLDRLGGDLLALRERAADTCRSGDHAREQLGALVADVLELGYADVLHAGQARALGRARVADRGSLHGGQGLGCEGGGGLLLLRDRVGRGARAPRDRGPAPPGVGAGGLESNGSGRPGGLLPGCR